jgi:serine/threonine protein kinase
MVTCIGREGEGIVLDPVDGTDLAAWFQEQRGNWQPCLPVIGQICDLVASLHSFGIVHHDLRPALFFLEAKQKVRLFDLGYAHWRELPDLLASSGVGPIGDYRYMAPELLRGERGDPRSDIYSLGMLVYLAAAGTLPFAEEKTLPDAWLERKKELPPLRQLRPDISKNLENVLARALAWKPEKRYQWVEDFWHDLAACLEKTG